MFCRNITSFICIFVAVVVATVQNDSHSITESNSEATVYPSTAENPESSTWEPDQLARETIAVDLGALLDGGDGAIVTLVAGDTRLAAHKAVLAARSPVFATSLQRMTLDANSGQVAIPDVEGQVLRQLLAYIYTLQPPQLPTMAPQLLAAADTYGLSSLKEHCEQQVAAQLSVANAAATAVLAVKHSCTSLRPAAIAFIKTHIFHVMATQGWTDAMKSHPEVLIKVIQLLSNPPAETSAPPSEDGGASHAAQPHSSHSQHRQGLPSAAHPTTSDATFLYDAAVPNLGAPPTADSAATSATWSQGGHRDHDQTTDSPVSPTTPYSRSAPVDHTSSRLPSPAPTDSGATPATQTQSHHRDCCQTPATAAPPTTARPTLSPFDAAVARMRGLQPMEKGVKLLDAAEKGAVWEVEVLLAAGASVRMWDFAHRTPLHLAAEEGHVEVVRRLLAAGAQVDAKDWRNSTPLYRAAAGGHTAVVRLLVEEADADPNTANDDGRTPLHAAACSGKAKTVAALLQAGAYKGAKDIWGNTPLDDARNRKKHWLIDMLK